MICNSERLILRNLEVKDADFFFKYRSDKDLCKYQGFMVSAMDETLTFINAQEKVSIGQKNEWKQIAICNSDNIILGDCAIQFSEEEPRIAEIGCTISSEHHNKGYATEALKLLINHTFNNYPIHKFKGLVDIRNFPSQRMLDKIGFEKEAHFKKHYWDKNDQDWIDELQYGLLKENWQTF